MSEFDARARDWDADPEKVARAQAVAEAIREAVPLHPGMRALEYGCGTGLLSFALREALGRITLADSSEGMLAVLCEKIARTGADNMRAVRLDLTTDPLPAERFDLIYTLMTLHHIPDTRQALRQFRALLAPGGVLAIADLDAEDGSFHGEGFTGHNGFDRDALAAQLREAGLEEPRYETAFEMVKEVDGRPRRYPVFLAVARAPY